jgi:hypothetical protein
MRRAEEHCLDETIPEAERLLEAWQRLGRAHMMIGGACSCGIGGVLLALEDFEQDIADYLQAEAERLERQDVLIFLAQQAREGEMWSISKLLGGLAAPSGSVSCGAAAASFLVERLARTLDSFEKLHG